MVKAFTNVSKSFASPQSTNKYRHTKRPDILLEAKLEQTHQLGGRLIQLRERQQQETHKLRRKLWLFLHEATFSPDCADTTGERSWKAASRCPERTCCRPAVSATTTRSQDENGNYRVNDIEFRNTCLTRAKRREREQAFSHQLQIGWCRHSRLQTSPTHVCDAVDDRRQGSRIVGSGIVLEVTLDHRDGGTQVFVVLNELASKRKVTAAA